MQRRVFKKCSKCDKQVYAKGLCRWHYWADRNEKASKTKNKAKKSYKIPRTNKKSRARNKQYSIYRKDFLEKYPICAVKLPDCTILSSEVHHSEGRLGDKFLDISTWF